jgi:hypothetical protein
MTLASRFTRLRKTRRLSDGRGKIPVAQSSPASFAKDKLLAVLGEVRDEFTPLMQMPGLRRIGFIGQVNFHRARPAGVSDDRTSAGGQLERARGGFRAAFLLLLRIGLFLHSPHQGPARHFDQEIFSRMAVHAFAHARLAGLGNQSRLIILVDEIIEVVIRLKDHVPATSAVTPARTAFGTIRFAVEGHTSLAPMPGMGKNLNLVDEHLENAGRYNGAKIKSEAAWASPA